MTLKQLAGSDAPHQRAIGIQKIQAGQLSPIYPANLPENAVLDFSLVSFHQEEMQLNCIAAYIMMLQLRDFLADLGA